MMMLSLTRLLCLFLGLVLSFALIGEEREADSQTKDSQTDSQTPQKEQHSKSLVSMAELRAKLQPIFKNTKIQQISRDEDLGMFRLVMDNLDEYFVTFDGKYLITGDRYLIEQGKNTETRVTNLSSLEKQKRQLGVIKQMDTKQLVVFPAQGKTKGWVLVFTDIDCGYCRTFHRQIGEVTKLGIEVRYAAFPRSGIGTDSYRKAVEVWCAPDQLQAMTDAKNGKKVKAEQCPNPVEDHYAIGLRAGVRGTPTIFTSNDKVIPGYVPAARLAETLKI